MIGCFDNNNSIEFKLSLGSSKDELDTRGFHDTDLEGWGIIRSGEPIAAQQVESQSALLRQDCIENNRVCVLQIHVPDCASQETAHLRNITRTGIRCTEGCHRFGHLTNLNDDYACTAFVWIVKRIDYAYNQR